MSDDASKHPVPPATFLFLVQTIAAQASVSLGLVANPATKKTEVNLDMAKHFIDTLVLLDAKTKGNLTSEESQLLAAATSQLQMAFVQQKGKK
jgi:hypothetical protein